MKRKTLIMIFRGSLILSAFLLLSVTTPSASITSNVAIKRDSTIELDTIRSENLQTLKEIEYEFKTKYLNNR